MTGCAIRGCRHGVNLSCSERLLWRSLLPAPVASLVEQRLRAAVADEARLRLQLVFRRDAQELGRLPWEFCRMPDTASRVGTNLATDPNLILSRFIPLEQQRQPLAPEQPPLRVLVAVSAPTDPDLGPVVAEPVIEAVGKFADTPAVELKVLTDATLDGLLSEVIDYRPHVLHFIGHGEFDRRAGEGRIALLGPNREAAWLDDGRFSEVLATAGKLPRLIFLHLCEGAAGDYKANFAGLALRLARHDVPAVVAMQYPITNRAAISFAEAFYGQLAAGAAVDSAVQHGRRMLALKATTPSREFATPVLYLRGRTALLTPPGSPPSTPRA